MTKLLMQKNNQEQDLAFKALFERYKSSQMAHFYTLHTAGQLEVDEKSKILSNWTTNFLENILMFENNWDHGHASESLTLGHEDILIIETEEKSYKVSDKKIEEFFDFIRFRPSKLKYCITIFKDSQKISPILANKLLKTLEEPPAGHLFIFLKSSNEKSLATIDSRTINIHITNDSNDNIDKIQNLDFHSFLDRSCKDNELKDILVEIRDGNLKLDAIQGLIKEKPARELNLHHLIAAYINQNEKFDIRDQMKCLEAIKNSTEEIPFNGAVKSRLSRLLQFVI
ncbi:hypothetical protein [Halobacteriovorax sp.]|uniref:hypothetical protein n=1 Tax=Halobacteriovorax sp. TaxID=2020862 RepID=UPI003AF260A3